MRARDVTLPELFLVAGTRAALGIGLGLLLADKLDRNARRGAGWALALVGGLSTIPLAMQLIGAPSRSSSQRA
jgi:hypothetical protein